MLLTSCSRVVTKMDDTANLSNDQIVLLKGGPEILVHGVDGISRGYTLGVIGGFGGCLIGLSIWKNEGFEIYLSPGKHTVEMSYRSLDGPYTYSKTRITRSFQAEAGHIYEIVPNISYPSWDPMIADISWRKQ